MVDINDPLNLGGRLEREMKKLEEAVEAGKDEEESNSENEDNPPEPVTIQDAKNIKRFLTHLQADKNNKS